MTANAETVALSHGMYAHLVLKDPGPVSLLIWMNAARLFPPGVTTRAAMLATGWRSVSPVEQRFAEICRAHPGPGSVVVRAYLGELYEPFPSWEHVDTGPETIKDFKQLLGPACLDPHPCRPGDLGGLSSW